MTEKRKVATALKYDTKKQRAPSLVAKGKGVVAENIERVAGKIKCRPIKMKSLVTSCINFQ